MDVSGVASLLRPSLVQHYTYGGWQGTLEVQEYMEGIFKLLRLDPSVSLIQPLEAGQFIVLAKPPLGGHACDTSPTRILPSNSPFPLFVGLDTMARDSCFLTLYICND